MDNKYIFLLIRMMDRARRGARRRRAASELSRPWYSLQRNSKIRSTCAGLRIVDVRRSSTIRRRIDERHWGFACSAAVQHLIRSSTVLDAIVRTTQRAPDQVLQGDKWPAVTIKRMLEQRRWWCDGLASTVSSAGVILEEKIGADGEVFGAPHRPSNALSTSVTVKIAR